MVVMAKAVPISDYLTLSTFWLLVSYLQTIANGVILLPFVAALRGAINIANYIVSVTVLV